LKNVGQRLIFGAAFYMELKNKNIPIKFKVLILAVSYFLVGYFSLKLSIPSTYITPIFPATGVAFIGIYFWGYRVWPGLALGSHSFYFVVFITGPNSIDFHESASIGIAIGVVLQTIFVVWAFKKFCNPPQFFNNVQNILWFAVLPTGIGAFISPLIGTIAVFLSGAGDWDSFGTYMFSGWLAESTGILTVIPIFGVTVFKRSSINFSNKKNVFEYFIFVSFIFITGQIVFGKVIGTPNYPLVYSLFPFLVWAAFRFGSLATLITALIICCLSVWGSLNEGGPFVGRSSFETLVLLQAYCWFVMVTALVLIGAVEERVTSENKLKESNRLLDSIREIQNKYMAESQPKVLFDDLLNKFINLTESSFGFIGEVLHDDKGSPYLLKVHD